MHLASAPWCIDLRTAHKSQYEIGHGTMWKTACCIDPFWVKMSRRDYTSMVNQNVCVCGQPWKCLDSRMRSQKYELTGKEQCIQQEKRMIGTSIRKLRWLKRLTGHCACDVIVDQMPWAHVCNNNVEKVWKWKQPKPHACPNNREMASKTHIFSLFVFTRSLEVVRCKTTGINKCIQRVSAAVCNMKSLVVQPFRRPKPRPPLTKCQLLRLHY